MERLEQEAMHQHFSFRGRSGLSRALVKVFADGIGDACPVHKGSLRALLVAAVAEALKAPDSVCAHSIVCH